MINTSEHSCLPWDNSAANSSILDIHACVFLSMSNSEGGYTYISHTRLSMHVARDVPVCMQKTSASASSAPSINDHTKSVVFVWIWHCLTCVCTPKSSAQQARGRHRELEAEEVSTTNSLKHTIHIKDDWQRKRRIKGETEKEGARKYWRRGWGEGGSTINCQPNHLAFYMIWCLFQRSYGNCLEFEKIFNIGLNSISLEVHNWTCWVRQDY